MAVLDASDLVRIISEAAEAGLRGALDEVSSIAKEMVPVRSIYKKSKSRNSKFARSLSVGNKFVSLNGEAARVSRSGFSLAAVPPGGQSVRSGRSFQKSRGLIVGPSSSRARGRSNSTSPVIRTPYGFVGGKVKAGGRDSRALRQVKATGNGGFELGNKEIRIGRNTVLTDDLLSARGRYEVKTGRARTSGPDGDEIGGTLRDSIRVEGPFVSKDHVYGYVSAFAENSKGLNYGYFMEFGSRHNKPHPFLRPALWAATDNGKLVRGVIRGIKGAKISTGQSTGVVVKGNVRLVDFDQLRRLSIKEVTPGTGGI